MGAGIGAAGASRRQPLGRDARFEDESRQSLQRALSGVAGALRPGAVAEHAGAAHQNGDMEVANQHYKRAVWQPLVLRGSSEFASEEQYGQFLRKVARGSGPVGRHSSLCDT